MIWKLDYHSTKVNSEFERDFFFYFEDPGAVALLFENPGAVTLL